MNIYSVEEFKRLKNKTLRKHLAKVTDEMLIAGVPINLIEQMVLTSSEITLRLISGRKVTGK